LLGRNNLFCFDLIQREREEMKETESKTRIKETKKGGKIKFGLSEVKFPKNLHNDTFQNTLNCNKKNLPGTQSE